MKFDSVIVRDAEGERRFTPDQLPLRIGTGTSCEIRLPGPGNAPIAVIDDLDGEPFVQPVGRGGALKINDSLLSTSRRLAAGDELEFFGTRITVEDQSGTLSLQVLLEGSAYITRPPEQAAAGDGVGDETIAPTAFQRAGDRRTVESAADEHRWRYFVGAGGLVM